MKKTLRQFALLTTLATGTMHIANRFVSNTAEMKNILTTSKGQFYNWKNGSIFYTKRGSGSPILLIHSLDPICCGKEWTNLIKKLEKKDYVERKVDEKNKSIKNLYLTPTGKTLISNFLEITREWENNLTVFLDENENFVCVYESEPIDDNGHTIRFTTYQNKNPLAL